jgi:glycosyltransferase involved in cell wall biosynthesis
LNLNDHFVVGHVGRFEEQKNHSFLLDVFSELHRQNSEAVLLLAGDGELRKAMEQKAKRLGIADAVRFLGIYANVSELYQAMDVFVLPSLFEGLGIVAIEAQCAGLPVVASDQVPSEANITQNVEYLPLQFPAQKWAIQILQKQNLGRLDMSAKIREAGYDITAEAVRVEKLLCQI